MKSFFFLHKNTSKVFNISLCTEICRQPSQQHLKPSAKGTLDAGELAWVWATTSPVQHRIHPCPSNTSSLHFYCCIQSAQRPSRRGGIIHNLQMSKLRLRQNCLKSHSKYGARIQAEEDGLQSWASPRAPRGNALTSLWLQQSSVKECLLVPLLPPCLEEEEENCWASCALSGRRYSYKCKGKL